MSNALEVNFDGIVGPTHNYAGLSFGNVASQAHGGSVSHPREAALQGLAKMKFLHDLGVRQAVLPPQPRPDLGTLRRLGFGGSDADLLWRGGGGGAAGGAGGGRGFGGGGGGAAAAGARGGAAEGWGRLPPA